MIPAWILDIFAAVMLAVAAVSAARLAAARPWRHVGALADTDLAHLLMAIAMAGMLAGSLRTLPNAAWAVIFGVLTAWFAYRVARDALVSGVRALTARHCAPHLVHAAAMLYMFLAVAAPAARGSGLRTMAGSAMDALGVPVLAFAFALLLIGYSVWDLDQLSGPGVSGHYRLATATREVPVTAAAALAGVPALPGTGSLAAAGAAAAEGGRVATIVQAQLAGPDTLTSPAAAPSAYDGVVLAPWVAAVCRIAMGVTMAFMLLIMI